MATFTILPIRPTRRTISHIPYPPPILTKHHTWYSNDADLFISLRGILFGLHRAYFTQSLYFQTIMDVVDSERPVPRGSQILFPIPFDDLDQLSFTRFLSFLYQTRQFQGTKREWEDIRDYCVDWYLPQHTVIAVRKLLELRYTSFTHAGRQTLRTVNLSYDQIDRQRNHWRTLNRRDNNVSIEVNRDILVEDDSV